MTSLILIRLRAGESKEFELGVFGGGVAAAVGANQAVGFGEEVDCAVSGFRSEFGGVEGEVDGVADVLQVVIEVVSMVREVFLEALQEVLGEMDHVLFALAAFSDLGESGCDEFLVALAGHAETALVEPGGGAGDSVDHAFVVAPEQFLELVGEPGRGSCWRRVFVGSPCDTHDYNGRRHYWPPSPATLPAKWSSKTTAWQNSGSANNGPCTPPALL